MKRFRVMCFFCAVLSLFVSGCATKKKYPADVSFNDDVYRVFSNKEIEDETSSVTETIVDALKSGNVDEIVNIYCEDIKARHDIKLEAKDLFEYIDGDVIEIQNSYAGISSSTYYDDYGDIELFYSGRVEGIKTNTEKTYEIGFYGCFFCRDHDEKMGLSTIYAYETDEGDSSTGVRVGD